MKKQTCKPAAVAACVLSLWAGWGHASPSLTKDWDSNDVNRVWGDVGIQGIFSGERMAPNGVAFKPLFCVDVDVNVALSADRDVYLFSTSQFWGQRSAPGITNKKQGPYDFSKREYDFNAGVAWNYWRSWELRGLAYSFNNFNRGTDLAKSSGYKDGTGIEDRYYFHEGRDYIGLGYYFTKEMVDQEGAGFKPGFFVNSQFSYDIKPDLLALYARPSILLNNAGILKLLDIDAGVSWSPFTDKRITLDLGADDIRDCEQNKSRTLVYGDVNVKF